jgi:hypothetical protein
MALGALLATTLLGAPALASLEADRQATQPVLTPERSEAADLAGRLRVARSCVGAPSVSSDIDVRAARFTTRLTTVALSGAALTQHGSLRARNGNYLRGMAHMKYGFGVSVQMQRITVGAHHCIRVANIVVSAGQVAPEIWLHPDLQRGSCDHQVTVNHEQEHVANYHAHLRSFEASLKSDLPRKLSDGLSATTSDPAAIPVIEKRLRSTLVRMISDIHDRSQAISRRKDEAMDTPANYRRLSMQCR